MTQREVLERTGSVAEVQFPIERLQIKNILCPVDFSDFSSRALRYAIGLARHFGSRLFVQHTAQPSTYQFLGGMEANAGMVDIETQLQAAREEVRRMLISAGIDTSEATVLLNEGFVPARILETISKERIDLVVMGTHGHRGFNRAVLGSVAESMIHQAVCPVLVVSRPQNDFGDPDQGERLRTILLATDFSTHSDRALAYALKWGYEWCSKIVVFHAVQQIPPAMKGMVDLFPEYNRSFEKEVGEAWDKIRHLIVRTKNGSIYSLNRDSMTWRRIEGGATSDVRGALAGKLLCWPEVQVGKPMKLLYPPLERGGFLRIITTSPVIPEATQQTCEVVYEVRHGNPKEEILRVAEEKAADLIITGARGTGRSGAPWGSVSSAVVRDGRFPVLVVRDLSA